MNQIEKKSEQSELEFREFADAMPQLVWMANPDREIIFCNNKVHDYFQDENNADPVCRCEDICHPDDVNSFKQNWYVAIDHETSFEHEHRLRMKNGSYRWHLTRVMPRKGMDGEINRWLGTATDIHDKKVVEQKFRFTETLLQSQSDAIIVTEWIEDNFSITRWNKGAELIYGWTREEVLGKNPRQFLPTTFISPEDKQIWQNDLVEKGYWKGEVIQTRKDGATLRIMSSLAALKNESGIMIGAVAVNKDITGRHRIEQDLAYQKKLLETVADNTTLALFMMDEKQCCVYMNEAAEKMTGFTFEQVMGRHLHDVIHHSRPDGSIYPLNECPIDQALPTHRRMQGEETFIHADGHFYDVAFTASPIVVNGNPIGTVIEVKETTEDKRREKELQEISSSREETVALLESLLEHAPVGFAFFDREYRYFRVNETLARMNQRPVEEHLHKTVDDILPESAAKQLTPVIDQIFKTGVAVTDIEAWVDSECYLAGFYPVRNERNGEIDFVGAVVVEITDRIQADAALRKSEERFREFSNNIENLAWIADGDGFINWYNQRWFDYTGTTLDAMRGWGWKNVHHPEHVDRVMKFVQSAFKKDSVWELTFPLRNYKGEYRWFLTRVVPIKDEHGNVLRWIGTNTDIHEKIETARELALAKEKLELTFSNIPAGIFLFDSNGDILFANQLGAEMFGYANPEEITNEKDFASRRKHIDERILILNEEGKEHLPQENSVATTLRTGKPTEVVVEMIYRETGRSMWLLLRSSPLFDYNGNLKMVLTTSTDITLQKKSEQAIRQSEYRFRTLIEAFPHMAWTASPDGSPGYFNKYWYEFTGISKEEGMAIGAYNAIHPEDIHPMKEAWNRHLLTKDPLEVEVRYRQASDQKYYWFLVRGNPVKDDQGNVTMWIGTCTNIHQLKDISSLLEQQVRERTLQLEKLNGKLEQHSMELQKSNEDLQQFAHITSHDLKEPVRKIRIFSNRLRTEYESVLPEKALAYTQKMEASSERLMSMVEGILQYSSIGTVRKLSTVVDLNTLLKNIEQDLEVLIHEKRAVITYDDLPVIHSSGVLLHQLFYNLLNNSLKFSKKDIPVQIQISAVKISAKEALGMQLNNENHIQVTVADNGIGFDQSQAEKIFKSFTRLNPKDRYEGTGLGLALCKKIVERHSGRIVASSEEGKGTSIVFILPVGGRDQSVQTNVEW